MSLLYAYRLVSLALATVFGVAALAYSARTDGNIPSGQTSRFSIYSSLGIVAGVGTLLTIPPMMLRDFMDGSLSSTIPSELVSLLFLGGAWISVGSIALHDAGIDFLRTCDASPSIEERLDANAVCDNTRFVVIFSFLTSLILFLYSIALAIMIAGRSRLNKPGVWTSSVLEATKMSV